MILRLSIKLGAENKVADGLSRVMIDRKVDAQGLLCALTVTTSLQMQQIFDELDVSEEIQKLMRDITMGKVVKLGYT